MTDRELLEMAAKAADIRIDKSETNGGGIGNNGFCITGDVMLDWHNNIRWNPLKNDGDALRLAVKLNISINRPVDGDSVQHFGTYADDYTQTIQVKERDNGNPCAATRRAIVRAAAEIGRGIAQPMPSADLPEDNYYKTQAEAEEAGKAAAEIGQAMP